MSRRLPRCASCNGRGCSKCTDDSTSMGPMLGMALGAAGVGLLAGLGSMLFSEESNSSKQLKTGRDKDQSPKVRECRNERRANRDRNQDRDRLKGQQENEQKLREESKNFRTWACPKVITCSTNCLYISILFLSIYLPPRFQSRSLLSHC